MLRGGLFSFRLKRMQVSSGSYTQVALPGFTCKKGTFCLAAHEKLLIDYSLYAKLSEASDQI